VHRLDTLPGGAAAGALPLVDVYHVSLQNTNTGRLTETMFDEVLAAALDLACAGAPRVETREDETVE
jgi:uracil-DNA glycosylase